MMQQKGVFITFEGGDGSGKSTQVALLADYLRSAGVDVVTTCEPQKGGRVRELLVSGKGKFTPEEEARMMFEDRADHLQRVVYPALAKGQWVISDRFADSTRAYQGAGMGVDAACIDALYADYVGNFAPDVTIILDIDPAEGLARSLKHNQQAGLDEDKYEKLGLAFHTRLREGYLAAARQAPNRCVVIDASGTLEEVQQAIRRTVQNKCALSLGKVIHG